PAQLHRTAEDPVGTTRVRTALPAHDRAHVQRGTHHLHRQDETVGPGHGAATRGAGLRRHEGRERLTDRATLAVWPNAIETTQDDPATPGRGTVSVGRCPTARKVCLASPRA